MIEFGDVFRHLEKEYVFLHKTEELIYAAQILDSRNSLMLSELYKKLCAQGRDAEKKKMLYCFVELQTTAFKGRSVHVTNRTDGEITDSYLFDQIGKLDNVDLIQLQDEIIGSDFIADEVQNFVSKLKIDTN